MQSNRPKWDETRALALIGSHVLIGITRLSSTDQRHEQMFGTVKSTDAARGFEIELEGSRKGSTYWLPPDIEAFQIAEPGEYHLRSTGETVVNPDYIATWEINAPTPSAED